MWCQEKMDGALDSCFGLVGPHQQSIPQLLSLASRVYKGYQERSTCGSELMRFIPTRLCHWYVLTIPYIRGLEPRPLPTPAGQGQYRAKTWACMHWTSIIMWREILETRFCFPKHIIKTSHGHINVSRASMKNLYGGYSTRRHKSLFI